MLQLYYTLGSPPSRAVLQTIRILGLDVEVKNVNLMNGEQLTPEYKIINPLHQVPAIVDGDFMLAESRAIMAYLVNSRAPGSSWYPSDPKVRARIDQLLFFDAINFFELAASILRPIFFRGESSIPTEKTAKLKETLKHLEGCLEGKLYFVGNQPTIVDISILSTFIMFQATFSNYGEIPNVISWYKRCQSLPGFEENIGGTKAIKDMMAAKGMKPVSLS